METPRTVLAAALALSACATTQTAPPGPGLASPPARSADPNAPAILSGWAAMQCVPFARERSGIQIFGDAGTWWTQAHGRYPRSGLPAPGAVLALRGYNLPERGHVAVVVDVVSDREIRVEQANWLNGGEVSVRVPVRDVSASNDWSEVRVWHIPGGAWGGRVYQVEGFIHPMPTFADS
jgi:hypothetical protein